MSIFENRPGRVASGRLTVRAAVTAGIWAVLASLGALAIAGTGTALAKPPAQVDLHLERTGVIFRDSYKKLPPMGEQGEMGANLRGTGFSLAHQQLGDLYVRAGIIRGKPGLIRRGFRAFDYAFDRQYRDGSFAAEQAEEYAFFVEAVSHSVLLLRGAEYRSRFKPRLKRYKRKLRRAAPHMIDRDAWADFAYRNEFYTHTGYTMGTALHLTGKVVRDKKLLRYARKAIRLSLVRQRPDGVNPELGGHDVRYQMAGIVYAERFSVYSPDTHLKRRVERMVDRGIAWMLPRVDESGWIDWSGSTRVCREHGTNGKVKSPGYSYTVRGFAYWARLKERTELLRPARRVHRYARKFRGASLCEPNQAASSTGTTRAQRQEERGRVLSPARAHDLYE